MKNAKIKMIVVVITGFVILAGVLWRHPHRTEISTQTDNAEAKRGIKAKDPAPENIDSDIRIKQVAATENPEANEKQVHADPVTGDAESKPDARPHIEIPSIRGNTLDEVYAFLKAKDIPRGLKRGQVQHIKNEMLSTLCRLRQLPPNLTKVLTDLYRDPQQDVVVRDYVIQHLGLTWYMRAPQNEKEDIRTVLFEALDETDSSIGGTALLALNRLSKSHSEFNRDDIKTRAMQLAKNDDTGVLTRISAVQVCGKMGIIEIVPVAEDIMAHSTSLSLRMAAQAALVDLGEISNERLAQSTRNRPCFDCD